MSKRIYVLYTGGTIGMHRSADGYAPAVGLDVMLREGMAPRAGAGLPDFVLDEYPTPIDSADAQPGLWRRIAGDIAARYAEFDGFVVLHGTDTMAYTASALSFMLQGLTKPVIVTGSQIPLSEIRNDAANNLQTALILAAEDPVPEVCLYFNGRLLRGNRATKVHAVGFDAFDSPNYPWLGQIGVRVEINREALLPASAEPRFALPEYRSAGVAIQRVYPGISAALLDCVLRPPLAALVLETYGVGNAPASDKALLAALSEACGRGVVVVAVSQCAAGGVDLASYAAGTALREIGIVPGADLTSEAAYTKLHHLLALEWPIDEIRAALPRPLCGECSA